MQYCREDSERKDRLEKKMALTVARVIKETTGKGPTNYKSYLTKDLFVLMIRGFLCQGEVLLSQTERGKDKVRQFRLELTQVMNKTIQQEIKNLLSVEPSKMFADVDVENNEGIIVLIFKEDLTQLIIVA
ncbi:MAG: hypothetical protein CVU89_04650 [Firmicutes bacterium HGW-Firmicutes-14]|nr:MAG: hypothetical protein CVU89_04650 [Firmicutes bacterium HGW-Firmicutes-14]